MRGLWIGLAIVAGASAGIADAQLLGTPLPPTASQLPSVNAPPTTDPLPPTDPLGATESIAGRSGPQTVRVEAGASLRVAQGSRCYDDARYYKPVYRNGYHYCERTASEAGVRIKPRKR